MMLMQSLCFKSHLTRFSSTILIIIINLLNKMFLKIINITIISLCFILINLIKRCDIKNYRIF